ncbi:MAG: hypothetical protein R2741_16030, partial [Methanolobus sp.]
MIAVSIEDCTLAYDFRIVIVIYVFYHLIHLHERKNCNSEDYNSELSHLTKIIFSNYRLQTTALQKPFS